MQRDCLSSSPTCQGGPRMATRPAATLCRHSPQTTLAQRGLLSVAYNTISVQFPPSPPNTSLCCVSNRQNSPGEGKHKVPTAPPGAPELGTANTTVLATDMWAGAGQKQPRRSEICCTPPEKLHFKNRNSCSNVTCLEKAKHPLPLGSVIACGVCCQAPSTPGLHRSSFPACPVQKELLR